jgi:chromate reductase
MHHRALLELKLTVIEIGQLLLYNQDGEQAPPPAWTVFRERVSVADTGGS